EPLKVLDGYAPFCKLHVHRNWTSTRCLTVPVTDANRHLLRTAYEARTREELPVLVRWFEGVEPPVADYLVVILYSREQLAKEGSPIEGDWGVVGCLYAREPEEIPMAPVTMMRNALGVEGGGSCVRLYREPYRWSVKLWEDNACWRPWARHHASATQDPARAPGLTCPAARWAVGPSPRCRQDPLHLPIQRMSIFPTILMRVL